MPDIPPRNLAVPSNTLQPREERGESSDRRQPRTPSCFPTGSGWLACMGIGGRERRAAREEDTPPSRPTQDERQQRVPSASFRQLAGSPALSEDVIAQEMNEWARQCESNSGNWYEGWLSDVGGRQGFSKDCNAALTRTAALLASNASRGHTLLHLQHNPIPEFPPDLSRLAHLSNITIIRSGLQSLPESIDTLQNLHTLKLTDNPLQALPDAVAGLNRLETLDISGSPSLTRLPDNLVSCDASGRPRGLVQLETLKMQNTGLTELPACLGLMGHLKTLNLDGSPLQKLPDDIEGLTQLQTLCLRGTAIMALPPSLETLHGLNRIDLGNCAQLRELPNNIGALHQLRYLNLSGCNQLQTLPDSVRDLHHDCIIEVPPHLRRQLAILRAAAVDPEVARAQLAAMKAGHVETISRWMVDQVMLEEENPFVPDNPDIDPDKSGKPRLNLSDIPALRTLLFESKQPDLVRALGRGPGQLKRNQDEALTTVNLSDAVMMWRKRELAVARNPDLAKQFKVLDVYVPDHMRSLLRADEPPVPLPPMSGPDAAQQAAIDKRIQEIDTISQWMENW